MNKPFSPSCDRNKAVILQAIQPLLTGINEVLEIGSGTGQHGVYFAEHIPGLKWRMSDQAEHVAGINQWVQDSRLSNVCDALVLDVTKSWPIGRPVQAMFTANSLHIMGWPAVECLFAGVGQHLQQQGLLMVYGPFNYDGAYTSTSNAEFDQWLMQRDSSSAIRDFEAVNALAMQAGLSLWQDIAMPANNRLLIWRKKG